MLVLRLFGLYIVNEFDGRAFFWNNQIVALSVIALIQFLVNTSLASMHASLKENIPPWETWKTKYIWTFFSYFIGAAGAGLLVILAEHSRRAGGVFSGFAGYFLRISLVQNVLEECGDLDATSRAGQRTRQSS